ncbi:MAG: diacylglycerol kinase family protein [Candidatus Marinamargulisbacteria bacterium]|nr:diacylglycerol kinase family protein [Candidatus Marinamargulisbacteria bacterium]
MTHIACIANTTAGRYRLRDAQQLDSAAEELGMTVSHVTQFDTQTHHFEWPKKTIDAVWIMGGDGTIRDVVTDMKRIGLNVPIGITPLGTCNVLAHALGITRGNTDYSALRRWTPTTIRMGLFNTQPFLMAISTGIDASIVHHVSVRLKRWIGRYAYAIELIRHGGRVSNRSAVVLETPTQSYVGTGCIITNTPHYAGPFVLTHTPLTAPALTAVVHRFKSVWHWVWFLVLLVLGKTHWHPQVQHIPITTATLHTGQPIQCDGDGVFSDAHLSISATQLAVLL